LGGEEKFGLPQAGVSYVIDLQEINRKFRAGIHEPTGVSQYIF
jgi:hypothetical protein